MKFIGLAVENTQLHISLVFFLSNNLLTKILFS